MPPQVRFREVGFLSPMPTSSRRQPAAPMGTSREAHSPHTTRLATARKKYTFDLAHRLLGHSGESTYVAKQNSDGASLGTRRRPPVHAMPFAWPLLGKAALHCDGASANVLPRRPFSQPTAEEQQVNQGGTRAVKLAGSAPLQRLGGHADVRQLEEVGQA